MAERWKVSRRGVLGGGLTALALGGASGKRPDVETPDFRHFAPMVQRMVDRHCGRDA